MKTRFFLVAALVALGFTACNTDDVLQFEEGARAVITLRLFSDVHTSSTRAVGNLAAIDPLSISAQEAMIHTLQVFIFKGEQLESSTFFNRSELIPTSDNSLVAEGIDATSGPRTMVVVANHTEITGYPSRSDLLKREEGVPLIQNLAPVEGVTRGLVMTSREVAIDLKPGENLFGRVNGTHHENQVPGVDFHHINGNDPVLEQNLALVRINARVALTHVSFNPTVADPRFNNFRLVEVAVFNARNHSKLFGSNFELSQPLVHGTGANAFSFGAISSSELHQFPSTWVPKSYQIGIADADLITNVWTRGITFDQISLSNAVHFYLFENHGDQGPPVDGLITRPGRTGTFIVLRGHLMNGNDIFELEDVFTCKEGFTYYPIWINDAQWSTFIGTGGDNVIRRNTRYNITVNILGPGRPSIDPKQDAFLDVHVEVAPWIEVGQIVNW